MGLEGRHVRGNTTPPPMEAAPAKPAATPTGSSVAFGVRISSATPASPTSAAQTEDARIPLLSKAAAINTASSGWTAPTVAATPPGRR